MIRTNLLKLLVVSTLTAGVLGAGSSTVAAPAFEGSWSVLIITEKGDCDRAFRYAVKVQGGEVKLNEAGSPVDLEGKIAGNGAVRVSLRRGNQRADGMGRLGNATGSGTWKGASSSTSCSGRWEAEKR